jgi:hypothetical protein
MKTLGTLIGLLLVIFLLACSKENGSTLSKADASESGSKVYDASADGAKQIAEALALATKNRKKVLLQFGGDWCIPCLKLHKLFETNKTISEALRGDYVVVHIEYNERNDHLVTTYRGRELGLPFLVILDSDGKHLTTKNTQDFEEDGHHNPQKVLEFLKAPPLLTNNAPTLRGPVESSGTIRDEVSSRQIAMALLEMHHQWFTNGYRSKGMKVPRFLAEQGDVSGSSAGILGAYVRYDFQNGGIEWTRKFHILRPDTNAMKWVLYESATPRDTNLLQMSWKHELITVRGEP